MTHQQAIAHVLQLDIFFSPSRVGCSRQNRCYCGAAENYGAPACAELATDLNHIVAADGPCYLDAP